MPLRDYQKDAIAKTYQSLRQVDRVMLSMPTGAGKTHVASGIIQHGLKHSRRIGFLVDRLTLVDQTLARFSAQGVRCGVMQANHPLRDPDAPVQIMSVQTLRRRPLHTIPHCDLYFHDEAHDKHKIVWKLMDYFDAKWVGLSATPFTTGLANYWQDLVFATTTADLIEMGYLSPYRAFGPSSPNMSGARIFGGDWASEDARTRMEPLTGDITAHYQSKTPGKKAIVFCTNVRHAIQMAEAFRSAGVEAAHVSGKDSDDVRRDTLTRYAEGDIKVLTNCEVLTKGYDQPDIEVGIFARPTRSLSLHIQMMGRVLRTAPGKREAILLDHAGNIGRLGFPDDPLPQEMCDKESGVSSRDRRNANEPEPWTCGGCHNINPPDARRCAVCDTVPEREGAALPDSVPGVLQELAKQNRADKQTVWAMLNYCRRERGYQMGWVYHSYKALFGVGPNNRINQQMIVRPTREMRKWVNERLANSRKHYYASRPR